MNMNLPNIFVQALSTTFLLFLSLAVSAQTPTFYVEDAVAAPGEEVLVNVRSRGTDAVTGIQLSLSWDRSKLEYRGVTNIALNGDLESNFNQSEIDTAGRIGYIEVDNSLNPLELEEEAILFSLRFMPRPGSGLTTEITFTDDPVSTKAADEMAQELDITTTPGTVDLASLSAAAPVVEDARFTAAPNPFADNLHLDIRTDYAAGATLSVLTLEGRDLGQRDLPLTAGRNTFTLTATDFGAPGTYLLKITTDREQLYRKVVYRGGR